MARALISVYDKIGVVDFARELEMLGYEIISTGGTYSLLESNGIKVTQVSQITDFPEILEGRVKTLHPKIHGGILAKDTTDHLNELKKHEIELIDIVVVNLYPFEETISKDGVTLDEALENIDIGGPTMVRAAAKNFPRVTVVVNPKRYKELVEMLKAGKVNLNFRKLLAKEAFAHTARYDTLIANYLNDISDENKLSGQLSNELVLYGANGNELRYGENPHQQAAIYSLGKHKKGLADIKPVQGKPLSYNNYLDTHAAWGLVNEFYEPAAVIVKHNNPCGVAIGDEILEVYKKALACDPVSAFGGIVAFNREVTAELASELSKTFYEVIAAPGFSEESLKIFASKPNLRVLNLSDIKEADFEIRTLGNSLLVQEADKRVDKYAMDVVTENKPKDTEIADLEFANRVVKWVKSNAIVVAKDGAAIGIGAGQMNRVGSAKIALEQADKSAKGTKGAVLASDAFLPFADTAELAAEFGISAIIQPGGSVKDDEVIKKCNELGIAMVFTGTRHFKH